MDADAAWRELELVYSSRESGVMLRAFAVDLLEGRLRGLWVFQRVADRDADRCFVDLLAIFQQ